MSKRILVLCFIALLEATAHSQNKIALVVDTFLRNRENIISGEYTYRYMVKYLHDEEASEHKVKVRFYDLKRGPYFYTALIAENLTFNSTQVFDLENTYTFRPKLERRTEKKGKAMNLDRWYFFAPLTRYNTSLYLIAYDTTKVISGKDTTFNGSRSLVIHKQFVEYDSSSSSVSTYIFDSTHLPIYYSHRRYDEGDSSYSTYVLDEYAFNLFDSSTFFSMLYDSIQRLIVQCPKTPENAPYPARPGPLRDTIAPDFSYYAFGNDTIRLHNVLGRSRAIILDFWYTSCGPCQQAIPSLVSLYSKYKERGLEILGINSFDKLPGTYKWAIKRHGITYPLVMADTNILKQYQIGPFPTFFVIDDIGNIVMTEEGYSEEMEAILSKKLEELLK